jgi:hypothetical protein
VGQVQPHLETINTLCDGDDIHDVIDRISALETEDKWLSRARDGLVHGSTLAALWIDRQLFESRHMSLREVFQSELQLGTNIVRHPEFAEGVRALLIDKDRNPAWSYHASRDVPEALLEQFFTAPSSRAMAEQSARQPLNRGTSNEYTACRLCRTWQYGWPDGRQSSRCRVRGAGVSIWQKRRGKRSLRAVPRLQTRWPR